MPSQPFHPHAPFSEAFSLRALMQIQTFIPVVQRRVLTIDDSLLPLFGPLFSIETHLSMEERVELAALALKLPEQFVACEIGSYFGASTGFLAAAASLKRGTLHCVDVWDNRAMGREPAGDTFAEFTRNTARFFSHLVVHRGEADAMAAQVPGDLDLLFIDGDHSYAAVQADLANYGPKLKPGGVLLLHDFTYPEVQRATSEFLARGPWLDAGLVHSLKGFQVPPKA